MRFFQSTKQNRLTQRINTTAQLAGNIITLANPMGRVPAKIAQTSASVAVLCSDDAKVHERILNALQAVVSASEACLMIAVALTTETCPPMNALCKALMVCAYLYEGLLLAHFVLAEVDKEEQDTPRMDALSVG